MLESLLRSLHGEIGVVSPGFLFFVFVFVLGGDGGGNLPAAPRIRRRPDRLLDIVLGLLAKAGNI